MLNPELTIAGRIATDPVLRFVGDGTAVCNAKLAHTIRIRQADGKWVDGETIWIQLTAWGKLAETVATALVKGAPVIAKGRFGLTTWQAGEGQERQTMTLNLDAIGVDISMVRDFESQQGSMTLRWGQARQDRPKPVSNGVEHLAGQEPF